MANMYRAQILLEPEQHEALTEIARDEQRSISDLVREIVRQWLLEQETDELWRQRKQAMDGLRQIRDEVQQTYGIYTGNLIDEGRLEQDDDLTRIWKGEA